MSAAIFDFETIAKHARLKALDGTLQNVVAEKEAEPVEMPCDVAVFYGETSDFDPA